ncbi:hypothetical protein BFW01_g510 [Lasiodiplodia theobromae]|nr:hypothetical protein BFW01_g510 [Lasiodiplodia theobromae]
MSSTWTPPANYASRPVAVLGGGVLGRRIACCWASAGYTVHIRDPSATQRSEAVDFVSSNVSTYARDFTGCTNVGSAVAFENLGDAVADAWLVFEAVPEKLSIKIDTFAELEALAPADALLCSNSSSYKSSEMLEKVGDATKRRILNTHYFMPTVNMVVELMTDGYTEPAIFPFLVERHREAGLKPYVARKESTGFIFNRVWAAIKREFLMIMDEGVSVPQELDEVWVHMFGDKLKPCDMMDHVGLDTVAFIEQHYIKERGLPTSHLEYLQQHYPRMIWTHMGIPTANDGAVLSANLDGSDVRTLVAPGSGGLHTPKQIALDAEARKLYVCDREGMRVHRCNMDGSELETIVQAGDWTDEEQKQDQTRWCVGVAVAPALGRFFWTQKGPSKGGKGRIFSAEMADPKGSVKCLLEGLPEPIDLLWDGERGELVWTDRGEVPFGNSLNRVKLDACGEQVVGKSWRVVAQNFDEAIGVERDEKNKCWYVADLGGTVWRVQEDGRKEVVYQDKECAFTGLALSWD